MGNGRYSRRTWLAAAVLLVGTAWPAFAQTAAPTNTTGRKTIFGSGGTSTGTTNNRQTIFGTAGTSTTSSGTATAGQQTLFGRSSSTSPSDGTSTGSTTTKKQTLFGQRGNTLSNGQSGTATSGGGRRGSVSGGGFGVAGSGSGQGSMANVLGEIQTLADAIAANYGLQFEQPWEESFFMLLVADLYFKLLGGQNAPQSQPAVTGATGGASTSGTHAPMTAGTSSGR